jgi:hypothetical protein
MLNPQNLSTSTDSNDEKNSITPEDASIESGDEKIIPMIQNGEQTPPGINPSPKMTPEFSMAAADLASKSNHTNLP